VITSLMENRFSSITLSDSGLVQKMVQDLRGDAVTPVSAIERALEAELFEKFRDGLSSVLIKPPVVRLHSMYFKDRYSTLTALASHGYETWYTEIRFSTRLEDRIDDLKIDSNGINMLSIDYGFGVHRKVNIKVRPLKTQINHIIQINHLQVPAKVFQEVLNQLALDAQLKRALIANFSPGPDIVGYRTVSYDHILTGNRHFCSCAKPFHTFIEANAKKLVPQYVTESWPQSVVALLKDAEYIDGICHLCLASTFTSEDIASRYGRDIESGFEAFVDQVQFKLGVDEKTARAEVKLALGLSRWVREAELYGVVRDLFPDYRVLREASPIWLGRMRLDIYLPELNLAIEHQGEQHYRPISLFGGEDAHLRTLERDALKRKLCMENGVIVIDVKYDAVITKAALRQRLRRFLVD